jgi:hypothetical protein
MTVHSLTDRSERSREAAETVYKDVERAVTAARDTIMSEATSRLIAAIPQATIGSIVDRLGKIWSDAWPFSQEGER